MRRSVLVLAVLTLAAPAMAQAQRPAQPAQPTAVPGLQSNQPIAIEADRLEVRDRDKIAVFSGNVQVTQGQTRMRATSMRVFYDGDVAPGAGGSQQSIRRIEASGPIVITQPEQTATGEQATYDMASRTILLSGNVVLTQGRNVVRGPRLRIDMRTNQATLEGGRVQGLLVPGEAPPQPAPRPQR